MDFYLTAPVDEVLQQHFAENEERQKEYDRQIALAQAQPVKRGFFRNIAQERTESAKGRNEWWNKAVVPISTRAKRVNIKLRNKLRAYDYGVGAKLNQYYAQIKPFLDKWAKMTETDAIAFDLALKNSYVEKQLEIVNKYDAYDEFVAVKNHCLIRLLMWVLRWDIRPIIFRGRLTTWKDLCRPCTVRLMPVSCVGR